MIRSTAHLPRSDLTWLCAWLLTHTGWTALGTAIVLTILGLFAARKGRPTA